MALFHALSASGRTIVLVTHDASLAARCGRVARLEGGRVVGDDRLTPPTTMAREDS